MVFIQNNNTIFSGAVTFNSNATVSGSLVMRSGSTVDGRDVDVDGNVLDSITTLENLIIPIDYNDVNAVTIPSGVFFALQSHITSALNGSSSFKYLQEVWNALPNKILHSITVNLASGSHCPKSSSTGDNYLLRAENKSFSGGGTLNIVGASTGSWSVISASLNNLSISAVQAGNDNPYLSCSGLPFSGMNLIGNYARISTNQTAVIWENDDSTLYLLPFLSPTPTVGVDVVSIVRPSTIITNSGSEGVSNFGTILATRNGTSETFSFLGNVNLKDLILRCTGSASEFSSNYSQNILTRVLIDDAGNNGSTHACVAPYVVEFFSMTDCIIYTNKNDGGPLGVSVSGCRRTPTFTRCLFHGGRYGITSDSGGIFTSCVFREMTTVNNSQAVGAWFRRVETSTYGMPTLAFRNSLRAKICEFRNIGNTPGSNYAGGGALVLQGVQFRYGERPELLFSGIYKAAVTLWEDSSIPPGAASTSNSTGSFMGMNGTQNLYATNSGQPGGFNSSSIGAFSASHCYGFVLIGPRAILCLDTNTNFSPDSGSIRVGNIYGSNSPPSPLLHPSYTYSQLFSASSIYDLDTGNLVRFIS